MDDSSQEKKLRFLTIALMASGALNIGLIATGLFTQESASHVSIRPSNFDRSHSETGLEKAIAQMEKLSFHELVSFLTNRERVDEGYLKRDLSLTCLVAFHHFHLDKALNFTPIQRRSIQYNETVNLELFPGITDEQFEGIIKFAYEEKWPLTSLGLYKLLKKWPETKDESLVQAFLVTPEFHALAMLFQKSDSPQLVGSLIHLITEGPWELLDQFTKQQAQLFDLSVDRRRSLLLSYLAEGSKTAAKILLNSDFAFVSKRLEDKGIIRILSLLDEKSPEAERLCLEILRSPRSDAVWTKAAHNLYLYAGENPPATMNQKVAIDRFETQNSSLPNKNTNSMQGENPQNVNPSPTPSNQQKNGNVGPTQYGNTTPTPSTPQNRNGNTSPTPSNQQNRNLQNGNVRTPPQDNLIPNQNGVYPNQNQYPQNNLIPDQNGTYQQNNNSVIVPLNDYPTNNLQPTKPSNQPQQNQKPNVPSNTQPGQTSHLQHTVKEGESLWKISRLYNVKVDDIVQINHLEKDRLLPGMVLLIPN